MSQAYSEHFGSNFVDEFNITQTTMATSKRNKQNERASLRLWRIERGERRAKASRNERVEFTRASKDRVKGTAQRVVNIKSDQGRTVGRGFSKFGQEL